MLQPVFEDARICFGYYHDCICPLWEQVEFDMTEQERKYLTVEKQATISFHVSQPDYK
jgi:hypothetical protein